MAKTCFMFLVFYLFIFFFVNIHMSLLFQFNFFIARFALVHEILVGSLKNYLT